MALPDEGEPETRIAPLLVMTKSAEALPLPVPDAVEVLRVKMP